MEIMYTLFYDAPTREKMKTNVNSMNLLQLAPTIMRVIVIMAVLFHGPSRCVVTTTKSSLFKTYRKQWTPSLTEVKITRRGFRLGLKECQRQFVWNRWNCPVPSGLLDTKWPPSLTKQYHQDTRESALVHAIVAAGIAFELIRSCYLGSNLDCPCPSAIYRNETDMKRRLCGSNIDYAMKQSRRITRKLEVQPVQAARATLNWANNRQGIKTVFEKLPTVCRCHGATGSCVTKSCWKTLPRFELVGHKLKELYSKASRVSPHVTKTYDVKSVSRSNLVYIDESPNYCTANRITGQQGTLYRHCNRNDIQTCNNLCETCGYRTHHDYVVTENKQCKCQFQWCCKVICQSCPGRVARSYCAP